MHIIFYHVDVYLNIYVFMFNECLYSFFQNHHSSFWKLSLTDETLIEYITKYQKTKCDPLCEIQAKVSKSDYEITGIKV